MSLKKAKKTFMAMKKAPEMFSPTKEGFIAFIFGYLAGADIAILPYKVIQALPLEIMKHTHSTTYWMSPVNRNFAELVVNSLFTLIDELEEEGYV